MGASRKSWVIVGVAALTGCVDDWCDRFSLDCEVETVADRDIEDEDGDVWTSDVDCDDTDPEINPGAIEVCDGVDNDCDDQVDEGTPGERYWYRDADGDGYGDSHYVEFGCEGPPGWVLNDEDCDDADYNISPSAEERCDEGDVDEDCDGLSDDDDPSVEVDIEWWADADGDGYGDPKQSLGEHCDAPDDKVDAVRNFADCDDGDPDINPAAEDTWYDGVDSDCDGGDDYDADGDSYDITDDCDDGDFSIYPGANEFCDGVDHDCDSEVCEQIGLADSEAALLGSEGGGGTGSVLAVGLVDGDDLVDVVVAAPTADTVYALPALQSGDVDLSTAPLVIEGATPSWYLGKGLATRQDLDGDGYEDLALGEPFNAEVDTQAGALYVFAGPLSGEWTTDDATFAVVSSTGYSRVGATLAFSRDLSGDGRTDLVVGAIEHDGAGTNAGAVFVFAGPLSGEPSLEDDAWMLEGSEATELAGAALATVGDTDGDGFSDLLVGGYGNDDVGTQAGVAWLVRGPVSAPASLVDAIGLLGEDYGDLAGYAVAAADDLDDDGYNDLLVGAPSASPTGTASGAAYVLLGPVTTSASLSSADARLDGIAAYSNAGYSVAGGGDIDGDGAFDVLVGSPGDEDGGPSAGAVYVVPGPWSGAVSITDVALVKAIGSAGNEDSGSAVVVTGDVDGDGLDDFVVGAPGYVQRKLETGVAWFVLGGSW